MTAKQRHLGTFLRQPVDRLAWAANMDHWFNVSRANETIPDKYEGWKLHDIQRDLGSGIWQRVSAVQEASCSVKIFTVRSDEGEERFFETSVGTVSEKYTVAHDLAATRFRTEWMIKRPEDFRVVQYMVESMEYVANTEGFEEMEREVGEDGIVLAVCPSEPIMSVVHCFGLVQFSYALQDCPSEVDALFQAHGRKAVEAARAAAQTPSLVVNTGGNIEAQNISPSLYKRYALPVFQELGEVLHAAGKLQQYHFDGFIKPLIPLISQSQIDLIEGFTPLPVGDTTLEELFSALDPSVVVQGGIPSTLLCHGTDDDEFEAFVLNVIRIGLETRRLVLGLGDNTPPDANLDRLRTVSRLVEEHGWLQDPPR